MKSPGRKNTKKIATISIAIAIVLVGSTVVGVTSFATSLTRNKENSVQLHDESLLVVHKHVSLQIWSNGNKLELPANIGIDPRLYQSHALDAFGQSQPRTAPLHTHSNDGIIHIESTVIRNYTLGDFFEIWGLDPGQYDLVSVAVNGSPISDYESHVLQDGETLVMSFG